MRRIPNRNTAALLHNNIRNGQLLHRGCTVWFTVKPPRIQIITPQLVLLFELHHQSARVLHRGTYWDYATTCAAPTYDTEAPAYYTTKAVEYYTRAPKYDRNQSSELLRYFFTAAPKFRINFASNSGTAKSEGELLITVIMWNMY
jgi:hypothetical protein